MIKNPWPYAIVAYFAVFITAMAGWITFAMRNDMDLVRPDYYEHEIKFQEQIDQHARANAIRSAISIRVQGSSLAVSLPSEKAEGQVHLYRPANARLDRRIPLVLDASGTQIIDTAQLEPGLWKVRVSWRSNGAEYYFDQPVVLAGK